MWEPADGGGNGRAGGPDTFVLCSDIAGPWARTASFLTTEDEARATEGHRRLSLSQQNCARTDSRGPRFVLRVDNPCLLPMNNDAARARRAQAKAQVCRRSGHRMSSVSTDSNTITDYNAGTYVQATPAQ
jgi:hypothetical protein